MLRLSSVFDRRRRERRDSESGRNGWRGAEVLEDRLLLTTYTPAQISQAYGVNLIQFGSIKGDGTGQTIAIVDAYDAPNVSSDLMTFDATYGLPNTDGKGSFALTKATPQGTPAYDAGWAQETTLDVQWAHAIAPGAHILLVEAASNSYSDLFAAVDYARNQPGVSVVSMSWGGSEFAGETAYDTYLTTPSGHQGVSFFAAAGDTGAVPIYPAVSPNVVGVGGTTLTVSGTGAFVSETTWTSSGGGISVYESKPAFQSSVTQSSTRRTSPDVALDSNPSTGVSVYFTDSSGNGTWNTFGGTSIAAPQWAALVAIANQGRALNGLGSLDGPSQLLPAIYNLPASDFHDITQGTAGTRRRSLSAGTGYDLVTGRGSPYANLVVADLVNVTSNGTLAPALRLGSASVSAQSGSVTYGSPGSATYVVTVNRGTGIGSFDVNLSVAAGLPAGATFSFTVGGSAGNVLHFGASDNVLTAVLTITSGLHSRAGSATFTVSAERVDSSGASTGDKATGQGTLAINKRALTVSALGQGKVYDGTTAAAVVLTDNRVAGDTFSDGYASATFGDPNAGSGKSIAVTGIVLSGPDADNYTWNTTAAASADITARPITVAADAKSKVQGTADPSFSYQVTGGVLVAGDALGGALLRAAGESPGVYAIGQGTLTAGGNYALAFVPGTLTINPWGSDFNLTGPYVVNGKLAQLVQSGGQLSLVDENGTSSTGSFLGPLQVSGRGGLSATIDALAADHGRILWSDGTIWLKLSLGGQYYNPANNGLTSIAQDGLQLTLTNVAGGSTIATLVSPTQVELPGWGQTATFIDGVFAMSAGSSWRKLELFPSYITSTGGLSVGTIQDGSTNLVFVNRFGQMSAGRWTSPTTVYASGWNSTGLVTNGQISWNGGQNLWKPVATVAGTDGSSAQVSIARSNNQFVLTTASAQIVHAQITAPQTIVQVDGAGLIGTLSNGRIVWSDNSVWGNFDFNALDALFSTVSTFPL